MMCTVYLRFCLVVIKKIAVLYLFFAVGACFCGKTFSPDALYDFPCKEELIALVDNKLSVYRNALIYGKKIEYIKNKFLPERLWAEYTAYEKSHEASKKTKTLFDLAFKALGFAEKKPTIRSKPIPILSCNKKDKKALTHAFFETLYIDEELLAHDEITKIWSVYRTAACHYLKLYKSWIELCINDICLGQKVRGFRKNQLELYYKNIIRLTVRALVKSGKRKVVEEFIDRYRYASLDFFDFFKLSFKKQIACVAFLIKYEFSLVPVPDIDICHAKKCLQKALKDGLKNGLKNIEME